MKKIILTLAITFGSAFAIDLGILTIAPEVGATLSYNKSKATITDNTGKTEILTNDKTFSPGAYARLWLGVIGIMVAPQVKYDYLGSTFSGNKELTTKQSIHNIQYGGVAGFRIPLINLTPFVGASYSTFQGSLGEGGSIKSTYAVNFGVRWEIPFVSFLTLGFEGSWQKPEISSSNIKSGTLEILNLGGTIGLTF